MSDIVVEDECVLLVSESDVNSFIQNRYTSNIAAKYVGKFFNKRVYRFNSGAEKTYFLLKWQR